MGIAQSLSALALKQLIQGAGKAVGFVIAKEGADAVVNFLVRRFTDHSQRLTVALQLANDRAWRTLELALAGESLWQRCLLLLQPRDISAFRHQVLALFDETPLAQRGPEFRRQCLRQLRLARKAGLLTDGGLEPQALAERAGAFARFADPAALIAAEHQVIDELATVLRTAGCPALADLVSLRPAHGSPALAAAVRYFFRRQLEEDRELFQGVVFGQLESLEQHQEDGFAALGGFLASHGERLEELLGDVRAVVVQTHDELLDIKDEMERHGQHLRDLGQAVVQLLQEHRLSGRSLHPDDSLAIAAHGDRQLVRVLAGRLHALPVEQRRMLPALLNGVGMLEVAAGEFETARRDFDEAADVLTDPAARASAQHNAFQAAMEMRRWDDALVAYLEAATLAPERFGLFPTSKYEPQRILGAGGFGIVFLCKHRNSGSRVVVKAIRPDGLERDMTDLFREAMVLEELDHPAVIRLRDCDFADTGRSRPFLVMDYFEGQTLADHVAQEGPLPADELRALALPVVEALQAAHTLGILHRDVKPANLLVRRDGAGWRVKLIDFGLALKQSVLTGRAATHTTIGASIAGTRDYAAPEQMGRLPGVAVGPRSDIYGFGKTCCFALFQTVAPLRKHWRDLPEPLVDLLEACLAERPDERPEDFTAVQKALRQLAGPTVPVVAPPPAHPEPPVTVSAREAFWTAPPVSAPAVVQRTKAEELRGFVGHTGPITCVAFAPDGRRAVSGSVDKTLRLWDLASGNELRRFEGHTKSVLSVAWGSCEILSAGEDLTVRRWNVDNGRLLHTFGGWVHRCAAFSVDGRRVLSGSPFDGMVRLWDLTTGREVRRLLGHASGIWSVAFSADGRRAVSGGGEMQEDRGKWQAVDCTVRVWDLENGRELRRFTEATEPVRSVAYAPGGRHVAAACRDHKVRLWDVTRGQLCCAWDTWNHDHHSLSFSQDGRRLLCGGMLQLWLWDVESGKEIWTLPLAAERWQPPAVVHVAISPDGRYALSGGGDDHLLELWQLPE